MYCIVKIEIEIKHHQLINEKYCRFKYKFDLSKDLHKC